jgi:MFS family permease
MADIPASSGAYVRPTFSPGYKRLVLILLVTAYTLNFIDRTIISTIGQAIKADLKITDTQLGLLGGLYFALLYTFLGIPLARLAERFSRVNIISVAIIVWSGFTALCGTASSFAMLAAYRFGVGVGEAGLSPSSHSLISDYFEPQKRATALSVYAFGIPLGSMLGAVLGGWLAQSFSWRIAFVVVGIPGILVAIALKLLVKEPPRGNSEPILDGGLPMAPVKPPPMSLAGEMKELGGVFSTLFGNWPVLNVILGITFVSFAGYGAGQFAPPYFTRTFGLNYAQVGLLTGLVAGFSNGIGTLLGGVITDRLAKFGAHWYALIPAIGITLALPFVAGTYLSGSWQTAAVFMALPGLFSYVYLGPSFGVIQNMAPSKQRATAAAVMLFFVNLIALGGGPPFTGWLIDHYAAFHFAHPDQTGIWAAISNFWTADPGAFQTACPGGMAPAGAGAAAEAACHGALVLGTRHGILVTYVFAMLAVVNYLLAAFGLGKALAKARADRGEV